MTHAVLSGLSAIKKTIMISAVLGSVIFMIPNAAVAQALAGNIPQFMPSGSWNVEPTQVAGGGRIKGIKLPCMMVNSYDNGYTLRLSGGGGSILAMAIDYKQNVFRQGRKYDAVVSLSNGYTNQVRATAFSESVLIFNVRSFSGFYPALFEAQGMVVDVEGNPFQFILGNLPEAMQRLEACFGGPMPAMPQPVAMAPTPPAPMGQPMGAAMGTMPEPMAPDLATDIPKISKTPAWNNQARDLPPQAPRTPLPTGQMVWTANAGDDLRATLSRWASMAGVALDWQSTTGGQVVQDIRVTGSFENAVQALMAQNAAAMGLEANLMGAPPMHSGMNPTPISTRQPPMPLSPPPPVSGGVGRWNAPAGSSLQSVLDMWSREAGVELIWQANQGFAVKAPVASNGSYEEALQDILGQYAIDSVRPAAQLNNDPMTGRRILLVQSTRI